MAGSDLAPRKLDSMDKRNYKEMGSNQAATAKDKVQAVNEKAKQRNTNADRPKTGGAAANNQMEEGFSNWRAGNFGATPAQQATTLGEEIKGGNQKRRKNSARGSDRGNSARGGGRQKN